MKEKVNTHDQVHPPRSNTHVKEKVNTHDQVHPPRSNTHSHFRSSIYKYFFYIFTFFNFTITLCVSTALNSSFNYWLTYKQNSLFQCPVLQSVVMWECFFSVGTVEYNVPVVVVTGIILQWSSVLQCTVWRKTYTLVFSSTCNKPLPAVSFIYTQTHVSATKPHVLYLKHQIGQFCFKV